MQVFAEGWFLQVEILLNAQNVGSTVSKQLNDKDMTTGFI